MSTSELTSGVLERPSFSVPRRSLRPRLLESELRLVFRRRRNLAILAVLACAPVIIGVAIKSSAPAGGGSGGGPEFLGQVTQNGLFLAFASLVAGLPLFLPLAVAVASGESVAGEASSGSLRNLLVVPVSRTRLLAVKYAGIVAYAFAAVLTVVGVGTLVGLVLFPRGDVTLLSGSTIPMSEAAVRALLVTAYVGVMLAAVGAVGLFISTLTEVPMGAMAATSVVTVLSQILDSIPQVSQIHPYLLTHWWLAFGDLLRSPVSLDDVNRGLLTQAVYIVFFLSLAWSRFTTRDVTS